MSESKTKILITGGFGAIGYNLSRQLLNVGNCEIHIIDNFSSGVVNYSDAYSFSYLDISNTEKVQSFFSKYKPNVIFHLAAHFANQNSVDHPISDISANVVGLVNIFEAQRTNTELKKIVYASSSCVYGNNAVMLEDSSVKPYDTPYAINKFVGEMYCKYYSAIHKLPNVCIRIFNSYGPGEMPGQYRNVIPNFIQKALKNEDIHITGTGAETRDFTYVGDTVDLLIKLAFSKYGESEVFNGGTGIKTTIKELAETIIEVTGSDSKIIYTAPRGWDLVKDRCSDVTKSKSLLGYSPGNELRKYISETIEWIESHSKFS